MTRGHEIQQTVERVLDLPADHVDIGHGELCLHIVRAIGCGGAHIAHIGVGGTCQQQRLGTLAGGKRVVGVRFKHLRVCGGGTGIVAGLRQLVCLLMLRRHHGCRVRGSFALRIGGIGIAGIRCGTAHTGLLGHGHDLRQHLVGDLLHLVIAGQTLQQRHRAAADQREQRGSALHLQRLGDGRVGGDIDTGQLDLAVHRVDRVGERTRHREQAIVGRNPQEQQDREGGRGLYHRLERVLGGVDHVTAGCRGAAGLAGLGLDLVLQRFQIDRPRQRNPRIELLLTCHGTLQKQKSLLA